MPSVKKPGATARDMRALCPGSELILLQSSSRLQDLKKELGLAPMLGSHWSIIPAEDPHLAALIKRSVTSTRARMRLRTTLNKANHAMASSQRTHEEKRHPSSLADYYLNHFIDASRDALIGVDAQQQVLYWSAGAHELTGLSTRQASGKSLRELPIWSVELGRCINEALAAHRTALAEYSCTIQNRAFTLEAACDGVQDAKGESLGASVCLRDVTALSLKRSGGDVLNQTLLVERKRFQQFFDQAPGFIVITQGSGHQVELTNRAFMQLIDRRDVLDHPLPEVFPRVEGQPLFTLLDKAYATRRPVIKEDLAVKVHRQGSTELETRYITFVFQPIIVDDVLTGLFCQGQDVTRQKLAQEELQFAKGELQRLVTERTEALAVSQEALHQSQKLEAIGKLTGGVAHDFNNVLQIIGSNLQLLEPSVKTSPRDINRVQAASLAVDRGAKLASQLLAFARKQPLNPLPMNLARLVREMDDLLRRALGESIEIETVIAGGLWTTLVDPNQLENVILNMAINARDAMSLGGRLTIELNNALLDDTYVSTQTDVAPGQYVMLAVSDTGEGMPPAVIKQAFEPFFTTKPEGQGTGLGLSMAYGFAKQSGGHIRIYSEVGHGTTIKLYLPRTRKPETAPVNFRSAPVVGGTETILVVEDDAAVQASVIDMLTGLGYQVLRANDAQSAMVILQSGMSIDMLFTDVVMPGPMRSPELARNAQRLFPKISVLFTSGYTQNAIVHGGRLDPGVELLSKPYRIEELARKIRHLLSLKAAALPLAIEQPVRVAAPAEPKRLSVLVLEDEPDLLFMMCELIDTLDHEATGCASVEAAKTALASRAFDVLLADVNLQGASGVEFARFAKQQQPSLVVIFSSGSGVVATEFESASLPKPFRLDQLSALLAAHR